MNTADIKNKLNQLNMRSLVIIAALALPVVLLGIVMHNGRPQNSHRVAPPPHRGHPTLEEARASIRARLEQVKKMTPAQWTQERKTHPWIAATPQEAIAWNTNRLAQLERMTPEQWEAQFKPKPKAVPAAGVLPHTQEKATLPPISR